jgi:hypothetical protein
LRKEIYSFVTKIQATTPGITITQAHQNTIAAVPMPETALTIAAVMRAKAMNKAGNLVTVIN